MADDLMLAVLREIRDEVKGTNRRVDVLTDRFDAMAQRVDGISKRLDTTNERLSVVETTLLDLAAQQAFTTRWLRGARDREQATGDDVEQLRGRLDRLTTRVDRLEERDERH